jgi:hypothetical protein
MLLAAGRNREVLEGLVSAFGNGKDKWVMPVVLTDEVEKDEEAIMSHRVGRGRMVYLDFFGSSNEGQYAHYGSINGIEIGREGGGDGGVTEEGELAVWG